jgi:hypothetical protein
VPDWVHKVLNTEKYRQKKAEKLKATEFFKSQCESLFNHPDATHFGQIIQACKKLPEAKILGETRVDQLIAEINSKKS